MNTNTIVQKLWNYCNVLIIMMITTMAAIRGDDGQGNCQVAAPEV